MEANDARRVEVMTAVIATAVLVGLHILVWISFGPLWRDEISSLTLATKSSWRELWATLVFDPFPAVFFVLLRGWHAIVGNSDFALRALGCAIGFAGVAAFWVAARLTGRASPLIALTLLGFSPTLLTWGDSLRPYGVGVAAVVVTFACFWRLAEQSSFARLNAATAAAVFSVQSLFTNSVLVFACAVAAICVALRQRAWRNAGAVLLAGAVAAASLIPYAPTVLATQKWASIRKGHFTVGQYFDVLRDALGGWSAISFWLWVSISVGGLVAALWLQFSSADERRVELALYSAVAGVLALICTMGFFRVLSWPTNIWYYLPVLAIGAVAADCVIDTVTSTSVGRIAKVAAAALCVCVLVPGLWERLQTRASNVDVIAHMIEERAQPGDIVVIGQFTDAITFRRYFHGAAESISIPPMQDLTLHRWDELLREMRTPNAVEPVLARIDDTLRQGHQVWLVTSVGLRPLPMRPPPVPPFTEVASRPVGFFLIGWYRQVTYELQRHARNVAKVPIRIAQPISPYENNGLAVFSGWQDTSPAEQ
jgi:hypothetical protein